MRNVYGISDKVLALGLSDILIGAADVRPAWLAIGVQLIAVDTLVHNFLHRTGILSRFAVAHPYGPSCYRPGGCADLIRLIASRIGARQFNRGCRLPRTTSVHGAPGGISRLGEAKAGKPVDRLA